MLSKMRAKPVLEHRSEMLKKLWKDDDFRRRMHQARLGRPAPNKGVPASPATRLRMSAGRRGIPVSKETRQRMSVAKRNRPEGDEWPRLISESKKGKTREYFAMRREFRALHRDLKLWSDSYRSKFGKLPSAKSYDKFVAPMMVLRIRRYLALRDTIGADEPEVKANIIAED